MTRPWKEAASLILAARYGPTIQASAATNPSYNYKILCLKRHHKSSFMPGTYVFPGGMIHPEDTDCKWKNHFKKYGFESDSFCALIPSLKSRPDIFRNDPSGLPREVSLRITAIRETFEECGLLLCKQRNEQVGKPHYASHLTVSATELRHWQEKVNKDAAQFFVLCETLKCYPDLWSLHEWSNWLSPASYPKRFDAAFFVACLPYMPVANYDAREMEALQWDTPPNFYRPNFILPGPQYYELARISKFHNLDNFLDFAMNRVDKGVTQQMPVMAKMRDGEVYLFTGDSMYPDGIDQTKKYFIDKSDTTIDEYRVGASTLHRMEYDFEKKCRRMLHKNVSNWDGHVAPLPVETHFLGSANL